MDEERARHADVRRASRALSNGARHPGTATQRVRVVIMACYNGSMRRRGVGRALRSSERRYSIHSGRCHTRRSRRSPTIRQRASALHGHEWRRVARLSSDVIDGLLRIAAIGPRHLHGRRVMPAAPPTSAGRCDAVRFPIAVVSFGLAAAPTPQVLEGGKRSVAALLEALKPELTGEVLINGLDAGNTGPHSRAPVFRGELSKAGRAQGQYDPANVFRFNHNIRLRKVRRRHRLRAHAARMHLPRKEGRVHVSPVALLRSWRCRSSSFPSSLKRTLGLTAPPQRVG